ncbi:uncharacterized protein Dmoj_GI18334 [Drosophila mojavensis]|uniref:Uncharacterized protein n=1 Tax=Drosophila mojavensis TaxID=7230 RepID=B4KMK4_DROMO|nr:uncharacterized protein Dmoj_GI18334 [Drosophila mojavensis]
MREPARSIWESASRPLFVRSVWLERIGDTGRSHRRHFILDYEPREQQRQSAKRGGVSYESDLSDFHGKPTASEYGTDYTLDEYLLLGATKLTLQHQQQHQHQQQLQASQAPAAGTNKVQSAFSALHSRRHAKRRAWVLSSGKGYQLNHLTDHSSNSHSRRSSLQDALHTIAHPANPEERLAERVINWLDLAGRADIVKSSTPLPGSGIINSAALPGSQRISRQGHRAMGLKRSITQRETPRKPTAARHAVMSCSPSNAKPITIVFNKEGVPVRFNRPPRNIDLCALSKSPGTARRMAGQLSAVRLYNGAAAPSAVDAARTPPHSSRDFNGSQHESRKQLHIFMPSLPKKGLLLSATAANEDALSASLSELCF